MSNAAGDRELSAEQLRVVRAGHGANCSSIGSVIDTLFATATAGAALFAAVLVALRSEEARVTGDAARSPGGATAADADEKKAGAA